MYICGRVRILRSFAFGRIWQIILSMKNSRSPLEYPITIKQVDTYLIFSVRDFGFTHIGELPPGGKLSTEYLRKVMAAVGKCWLKSQDRILELKRTGTRLPEPSKIKVVTKELAQTKPLTVPQVAKLLNISQNSVRRIPKRHLEYRKTKGGHRRYSVGALKAYRDLYNAPN